MHLAFRSCLTRLGFNSLRVAFLYMHVDTDSDAANTEGSYKESNYGYAGIESHRGEKWTINHR